MGGVGGFESSITTARSQRCAVTQQRGHYVSAVRGDSLVMSFHMMFHWVQNMDQVASMGVVDHYICTSRSL
jgi:hypothetical protein